MRQGPIFQGLRRWVSDATRRRALPDPARPGLAATPSFDDLFDPAFLAALAPFALRVAHAQKGGRLAEQRTTARGQGSDFADFKPYVAGDDLRAIDWNIYRRLGKVFVRVFEERQDLPCYILVDRSHSMFVERPPRIAAALRAALALAGVAIDQQDSVTILPFADDVATSLRGASGRTAIGRVAQALASIEAAPGGTGLSAALRRVAALRNRRGLLIVVSDFFDDDGIEAVVDAMRIVPHRLLLVQVVRPYDADPAVLADLQGDVVLDDGESEEGVPITANADVLRGYARMYRAFNRSLLDFADGSGVGLVRLDADRPVLEQLDAMFTAARVAA